MFLAFLLAIGLSTFSSCSEEKKSPEEELKGKWVLSEHELVSGLELNDTVEYAINLSYGKDEIKFTSNLFPLSNEIKGSWKIKEDTIFFLYDKLLADYESDIDSVSVSTDSVSKPKVTFFSKDNDQMFIDSEGLQISKVKHFATITSQNENELTLVLNEVGTLHLIKEKVEQGGFSFMSILRGALGMVFLLGVAYLFSANRKGIDWSLVGKGVALQIIIALLVLKAPFVEEVFTAISQAFVTLIGYTNEGINFVFGDFASGKIQPPLITFAFKVLPTIIFFSALMSLLYYWGILQKIVYAFAWIMKKFMRLSGAESLAAAGNVFLGQTESPLLVKPYLLGMTKSEIMCLMTGGMATIAGGVLASYIGYLGGDDPAAQVYFAKHLLTASVISAPAAIVAAKMLIPETEKINEDLSISKDKIGTNALEAISNGTTDGLKLAVNVGAMLIVFISLVALANGILGWVGGFGGLNEWIAANTEYDDLSFEFILGYACAPIVWIMGVDSIDMVHVGELLGQKTILNEFYAYGTLGEKNAAGLMNDKSVVMATYMLCGFANIASIGIQIGGIGALVPSRKGLLSQLGVRALIGGTIACLLTAVVVGMTM